MYVELNLTSEELITNSFKKLKELYKLNNNHLHYNNVFENIFQNYEIFIDDEDIFRLFKVMNRYTSSKFELEFINNEKVVHDV